MFDIGPFELVVLAIVGLIVLGPDRLPGLAKDAARLLRSLREIATGAQKHLREDLGPEFADVDLRNLSPRTVVAKAVFGEELPDLSKYDPRRLNPGNAVRNAIFGDEPFAVPNNDSSVGAAGESVSTTKDARPAQHAEPRPRPRPQPTTGYDANAT